VSALRAQDSRGANPGGHATARRLRRDEYVTLAGWVLTPTHMGCYSVHIRFARIMEYVADRIRAEEYTTQTFVINVIGDISDV
jgi:hypothetical protein